MIRLCACLIWLALESLMSLVFEGAKVWLLVKPFKRFKAWRARRRGEPMAIDFGSRTSTNAGVAGLAVVWICQLVEQYLPGLLGANADDYLIVAAAWLVARFSRTPAQPKVL